MKILIFGSGKSGTTALAYAIKEQLDNHDLVFEPNRLSDVDYSKTNLIVKSLKATQWKSEQKFFDRFDRKILLVRHPFDRLISYILYAPYSGKGFSDDRNTSKYVDLLKKKTEQPDFVSTLEIIQVFQEVTGVDVLEIFKQQYTQLLSLYQDNQRFNYGFIVLKYEEFIDRNLTNLESYLNISFSSQVNVDKKHERVVRSKDYGDWKNWLIQKDIDTLSPIFYDFNNEFGYETRLILNSSEKHIDPKNSYLYTVKVINEYRSLHALPQYESGQINIGAEGVLIDRAILSIGENNLPQAQECISRTLEKNPNFPAIYLIKAKILKRQEKLIDALETMYQVFQRHPRLSNEAPFSVFFKNLSQEISINHPLKGNDLNLLHEGNRFKKEGNFERAIVKYKSALHLHPSFAPVLNQLSEILEIQNKFEEAIVYRQKLVNLRPDSAKANIDLSIAMAELNQPEESLKVYTKTLAMEPCQPHAYLRLGKTFEKIDRNKEAVQVYKAAISLHPNNGSIYSRLASIYTKELVKCEKLSDITSVYQAFLKQFSLCSIEANRLEKIHKLSGKSILRASIKENLLYDAACFFQSLIELQPDNYWIYYYLGEVHFKSSDYTEAKKCYKKSIELNPNLFQPLASLVNLFLKTKNLDDAFEYGIKALHLYADNVGNYPNNPIGFCPVVTPRSSREWKIFEDTFRVVTKTISPSDRLFNLLYRKMCQFSIKQKNDISGAISYNQECIYHQLKLYKPEYVRQYWNCDNTQNYEPDFMIIGAAKCGTTALYDYLVQHPQVLPAITKEIGYFSSFIPSLNTLNDMNDWSLLNLNKDLYLANFPKRPKLENVRFITGEASPANLICLGVEKIVYNWFPNLKLIAILRHPIKRAISHYEFCVRGNIENRTFKNAVVDELNIFEHVNDINQFIRHPECKYLKIGLYVYFLEEWGKLFSRDRFLVLMNEDLARNPTDVMEKTFNFLEITKYDSIKYAKKNSGIYSNELDAQLISRMISFYQLHNQRLEDFLRIKLNWNQI